MSFKSYWSRALLEALRDHGANLSIKVEKYGLCSCNLSSFWTNTMNLYLVYYLAAALQFCPLFCYWAVQFCYTGSQLNDSNSQWWYYQHTSVLEFDQVSQLSLFFNYLINFFFELLNQRLMSGFPWQIEFMVSNRYYKGQHIISVSSKVIEEHLKVQNNFINIMPRASSAWNFEHIIS